MALTFESLQYLKEQIEKKPLLIFGKKAWLRIITHPEIECHFTEEQIEQAFKNPARRIGEWYGCDCFVTETESLNGYLLNLSNISCFTFNHPPKVSL